jgi:hypothetical protein
MNNQEVGYVFAEKFNNEDISYGGGYNVLRGKGYSASVRDLVFDEQFYGDPEYGVADYGGNSGGSRIQWLFTSSLTQSFYNANPGIDPSENLYVLYQNYIPTGSGSTPNQKTVIQYTTYIPLGTQNFAFPPATTTFKYTITGEYYSIGICDRSNGARGYLRFGTGSTQITDEVLLQSGDFPGNVFIDSDGVESGSFILTASSDSSQLSIRVTNRYASTGSVFALRNLKITYPVDISNFEPFAQTQDLHLQTSAGMTNARYNGCKMTSPDFNIDSPDTVDGGPVVTITPVNPKSPTIGSSVPKNKGPKTQTQVTGFVSGKGNFKIK